MAAGSVLRMQPDYNTVANWLSTQEQGNSATASISYSGNVVNLAFMTNQRAHAENDTILTVPSEWQPRKDVDFVAYTGGQVILLRLYGSTNVNHAGKLVVWLPPQTPVTGRVYGNLTYIRG